jgi:hypothetical protein
MCDPRFDRVLNRLPSPVRTMVRRLRQPSAIWIRWVAGILLICGGLLSFLPILGLWMLPLGLMLLADDVGFYGPCAHASWIGSNDATRTG